MSSFIRIAEHYKWGSEGDINAYLNTNTGICYVGWEIYPEEDKEWIESNYTVYEYDNVKDALLAVFELVKDHPNNYYDIENEEDKIKAVATYEGYDLYCGF